MLVYDIISVFICKVFFFKCGLKFVDMWSLVFLLGRFKRKYSSGKEGEISNLEIDFVFWFIGFILLTTLKCIWIRFLGGRVGVVRV